MVSERSIRVDGSNVLGRTGKKKILGREHPPAKQVGGQYAEKNAGGGQ